ncbi:MAG: membrane protein insertion efficiency factor YidD [Candidatus Omnitrophota bacterium]
MKKSAERILKGYKKFISPYLPKSCRFHPTCSEYCAEAMKELGPLKGLIFSCWRILRCNPFSKGGYDPVKKEGKEK